MSADYSLVVNLPTHSKLTEKEVITIACFKPAFIQKWVTPLGELKSKFISPEAAKYIPLCQELLQSGFKGEKKIDGFVFDLGSSYNQFIQIPCGKCIGCRMDYSRSWADRMTYHVQGREEASYFLTLTYDDESIDSLDHSDNYDLYALRFDDMTDFIKKLRNRFRDAEIDYYYSGEYGDNSFRPHFHMVLYNILIPDLEFWKLNDNGDPIYTSENLHGLWKKGMIAVSRFSWRGAAYTASYVEKKRDGRLQIEYEAVGLTPEKCRMSRRPGIAHDFYLENYESIWKNNGMAVPRDVNKSGHLGIPRYFRKLAEKYDHLDLLEDFQKRSLDRSNVLAPLELANSSFDINSINQMLEFEEREILSRKVNKRI